jgi:hypothetical protein
MRDLNLPEPIAAYFEADRRGGDAVARCFTNDGVVIDEGRTHAGVAAIEAWKAAATAQYSYIAEPLALEKKDRKYLVAGRVTGDFPGSPVDLQFVFTLERGKIATLEITP